MAISHVDKKVDFNLELRLLGRVKDSDSTSCVFT